MKIKKGFWILGVCLSFGCAHGGHTVAQAPVLPCSSQKSVVTQQHVSVMACGNVESQAMVENENYISRVATEENIAVAATVSAVSGSVVKITDPKEEKQKEEKQKESKQMRKRANRIRKQKKRKTQIIACCVCCQTVFSDTGRELRASNCDTGYQKGSE